MSALLDLDAALDRAVDLAQDALRAAESPAQVEDIAARLSRVFGLDTLALIEQRRRTLSEAPRPLGELHPSAQAVLHDDMPVHRERRGALVWFSVG